MKLLRASRWAFCAWVLTGIIFLSDVVGAAPTPKPTAKGEAKSSGRPNSPSKVEAATWEIPDTNIGIRIHEADQSQERGETLGLFYHQPFLWLENPPMGFNPEETLPHVWEVDKSTVGGRAYRFRVRLSDPLMRAILEDYLIDNNQQLLSAKGINPDSVTVAQWPLLWLTVTARLPQAGNYLTIGSADVTGQEPVDYADFWVAVAEDKIADFEAGLASGKLVFQYSYSWEGRRTSTTEVSISYKQAANTSIKSELTSAQRDSTVNIYQGDVDRINTQIARSVDLQYRSETVGATPAQDLKALIGDLFEQKDLVNIDTLLQDEKQKDYLARYLGPLEQELQRGEEQTSSTAETKEKKHETKVEEGQEYSAKGEYKDPTSGYGGGASAKYDKKRTTTDSEREELEKRYGVKLEWNSTERRYQPHQIKVFRLVDGWQNIQMSMSFKGIVPVSGPEEALSVRDMPVYLVDSNIKKATASGRRIARIDSVPMWGVIPWYGVGKPPRGYILLDGSGWPAESWVTDEIRQRPFPNMDNRLIGGTADEKLVGSVYTDGKIELPEISIAGSDFQFDYKKLKTNFNCPGHGGGKPGFGVCTRHFPLDAFDVSLNTSDTNKDFSLFELGDHLIDTTDSQKLSGTAKFQQDPIPLAGLATLPEHVRMRWIMRVPIK